MNDDTQVDSDKHNELLSMYDPNDDNVVEEEEEESKHSNSHMLIFRFFEI